LSTPPEAIVLLSIVVYRRRQRVGVAGLFRVRNVAWTKIITLPKGTVL
jgi:hypothetical protein